MDAKRERLRQRRHDLLRNLPPLAEVVRGAVFERRLTCGKPYCHCARGVKHRVWYLSISRAPAAPEQITLPPELVATVRRQAQNYRRVVQWLGKIAELNRQLLRLDRVVIRRAARRR